MPRTIQVTKDKKGYCLWEEYVGLSLSAVDGEWSDIECEARGVEISEDAAELIIGQRILADFWLVKMEGATKRLQEVLEWWETVNEEGEVVLYDPKET